MPSCRHVVKTIYRYIDFTLKMTDEESQQEPKFQIGFRGTTAYREALQRAALDRRLKVQQFLEQAVEFYLSKSIPNSDKSAAPASAGHEAGNHTTRTVTVPPKSPECPKDSKRHQGVSVQLEIQSAGPKIQQVAVTDAEWRWVERVLKVLRGGQDQATKPLDTNLDAFVILTDLLTAKGDHGSADPTVSPAVSPPDTQREVDALRDSLKTSGQHVDRTHETETGPRKPRKDPRRTKAGNQ